MTALEESTIKLDIILPSILFIIGDSNIAVEMFCITLDFSAILTQLKDSLLLIKSSLKTKKDLTIWKRFAIIIKSV